MPSPNDPAFVYFDVYDSRL